MGVGVVLQKSGGCPASLLDTHFLLLFLRKKIG